VLVLAGDWCEDGGRPARGPVCPRPCAAAQRGRRVRARPRAARPALWGLAARAAAPSSCWSNPRLAGIRIA